VIKVKTSVRPFNVWILCAFVNAALELGLLLPVDDEATNLLVSSGTDGVHKSGSMHGAGWAVDFRTKKFTTEQKHALRDKVKERLGQAYDCILEDEGGPNEHLHVERDPIRGGFTGFPT
jgi:hypothetical protein